MMDYASDEEGHHAHSLVPALTGHHRWAASINTTSLSSKTLMNNFIVPKDTLQLIVQLGVIFGETQ